MLSQVTPPAVEPVALATLKGYLRLTDTASDTLLETVLLPSARADVEREAARALITQTWDWSFRDWGGAAAVLEVPLPPLQSITSIKYYDSAGGLQVLDPAAYAVSIPAGPFAGPGLIRPAAGCYWPTYLLPAENAITVRFVAGYGLAVSVPAGLVEAIMARVAERFYRRGDALTTPGSLSSRLIAPYSAQRLA